MIKSAESTARNTPQTQIFDVFDYGKKIRSLHKKIISLPEKIVLWDLSDRFGNNGKIFPSNGEIAESTGLPSKTVMNCLSGLKSKKFLNYKKQHNKNRRYIDLFDPEIAVANLIDGICQWGAKLIPKLSLVGDSTIPDQGVPYNRKEHKNRKKQQQPRPAVDCVVVPLFDSKIENALKDRPDIQRKWIQQSLKLHSQTVDNIVLAINESNIKDNPTGFIRNALEKCWEFDECKKKAGPRYVEITEEMTETEVKCCKCYNNYLNKPKDQRCLTVWGDTAPTIACSNCPGVIKKQIKSWKS